MYQYCPYCGNPITFEGSGAKCRTCKKSTYLNSKPAVGVVVTCGDELLVCERGIDPGKGKIDSVGGFLENGEKPIDGAIREFEEETGVSLNKEQLVYLGSWVIEYFFQGSVYFVLSLIYTYKVSKKPKMEAKDDVSKLVWIKKGEMVEAAFPEINEILRAVDAYLDGDVS